MVGNQSKNLILPITIVVAGLVIAGAFIYVNQVKLPEEKVGFLSPQQAAEKAINYINQNILAEGVIASLINVVDENGLYKIKFGIGENEFESYVTMDGKLLFPEAIDLESKPPIVQEPKAQKEKITTIGNFLVSKDEICRENEKPIIYFFGSEGCPHCKWEHPIIENVASKFKENIVFHNNMDSKEDMDIFSKYSTGGIPTLVLGCKYYRVGSGERMGEEQEAKILTALICKLTENQPTNICNGVQNLISQIHE